MSLRIIKLLLRFTGQTKKTHTASIWTRVAIMTDYCKILMTSEWVWCYRVFTQKHNKFHCYSHLFILTNIHRWHHWLDVCKTVFLLIAYVAVHWIQYNTMQCNHQLAGNERQFLWNAILIICWTNQIFDVCFPFIHTLCANCALSFCFVIVNIYVNKWLISSN